MVLGLRSAIQNKIFFLSKQAVINIHELKCIFFELTHNCNLTCLHCGSDCIKDTQTPDLPAQTVLKVLDDIRSKYNSHRIAVILSGGEPLCYPGVFELGRQITEREFPWGMVTNGYAWTPGKIEQARLAGLQSITVSLDGLEEDHNWFRGNLKSFNRAVRTIEMLAKNPFYQVMDVVTCVNKRSLKQIDRLYALITKLGVKEWRLFTISPIGRAVDHPELMLHADEFIQLLEKIKELRVRDGISVSYSESGYLGPTYDSLVRDHRYFCQAGISVAGIMVNGDIIACPNIDRRFTQGNIYRDSFVDVWENRYGQFRNRSWMKTGECADCFEWKSCQGNSFHLWDIDEKKTKLCYHKLLSGR
jgi:radical SAM enzyme (rSAM/lipoprotein system)